MPSATRQGAAHALPTPGQVIADKYAIVKVLGEGGMGIVFEATHLRLRQRVAVKMLLPDMLAHPIIVTRFEREARASGQLRNRHAARVMDVDVTPEGLPYMVMEFLEGHDLQAELDTRGRLPCAEVVDYVLQACAAMIEAHQLGIVHRDLKPANLFLAADGDARIVKVLDFGISKSQSEGDAKLTTAESVMGTAMYMSPEQLRSSGGVDGRTDIWSLGIILYELLTGRTPWLGTTTQLAAAIVTEDAPDVRTLAPDVPAPIAAIVAKTLRRKPDERFADVKQLALALAPFAPATGAGSLLADRLLGSNPQLPRVSLGAAPRAPSSADLGEARTLVQAPAVSESRMRGEGTAPGWSQPSQPTSRSRTALIGFILAFAVGLVVIGGSAIAWLRWSRNALTRVTATATPPATATAIATPIATPPATATPTPTPPVAATAPPPSTATPTPPATATQSRPSTRPAHASPPAHPTTSPPHPKAPPQTPEATNPIHL